MAEVSITAMQVLIMVMLLAVGAICYKIKLIGDEAVKSLSNIALYISTSAIIIESCQTDFNKELLLNIVLVAALAALAHILGIIIATLFFKKGRAGAELFRFASVFGNCGFMGIPLLAAILPENGALFASIYMTIFNVFTWTYGIVLFSGKTEKGFMKKILLSPVLISVAVGIVLFVFSIKLPTPIASTISYLSDLNTPLAMMVTGALIAKSNLFSAFKSLSTYKVLFLKLILTSFVMNLIMRFLPFIPSEVQTAVVVLAATPVASNTAMFADKFEKDGKRAGELVVVSTVLSIISIPLMVYLGGLI